MGTPNSSEIQYNTVNDIIRYQDTLYRVENVHGEDVVLATAFGDLRHVRFDTEVETVLSARDTMHERLIAMEITTPVSFDEPNWRR